MSQASIQALRQQLAQISAQAESSAKGAVAKNAERLAGDMRRKVPIKKGNLAKSIAVVRVSDATYRVQAGGDLTTTETAVGPKGGTQEVVAYDYARATEFGTVKEAAEPFFYSTYRADKAGIKNDITNAIKTALG